MGNNSYRLLKILLLSTFAVATLAITFQLIPFISKNFQLTYFLEQLDIRKSWKIRESGASKSTGSAVSSEGLTLTTVAVDDGGLAGNDLPKLGIDTPSIVDFGHKPGDESKVANDLAKKIRLLCWVMTSPENHRVKAIHVKETWGKRCDKLLFASEKDDGTLIPFIVTPVEHGRDHLTAKTMAAFDYVYKHHLDEYDWFLKADDDTYVIVENMKYFLSSQDPTKPVFFGHHFKRYLKQGYFSGGAGYILSKEALRRFGTRQPKTCREDRGAEDFEMGRCMEILGVVAGDSRDVLGRSRFHCFDPETHIHGGYPDWYYTYDKGGGKKGIESISDYAITFHYVSPKKMYDLEFYIYHLRPYGIISGLQELNVPAAGANPGQPISSMAPPTDTPKPEKQPTSTLQTNPDDKRIKDNPPREVERTPAVQVLETGADSVILDQRTNTLNGSLSTVDQTVSKSSSGEIEDRK